MSKPFYRLKVLINGGLRLENNDMAELFWCQMGLGIRILRT